METISKFGFADGFYAVRTTAGCEYMTEVVYGEMLLADGTGWRGDFPDEIASAKRLQQTLDGKWFVPC